MGKKLNQLINKKKDNKLISSMKSRIEKKKRHEDVMFASFFIRETSDCMHIEKIVP
jgi:hypothetical protein